MLAESLVAAARADGLELDLPDRHPEEPGQGISGTVAGRPVALGRLAWLVEELGVEVDPATERLLGAASPGSASVAVAIDGTLAGAVELADPLRDDAAEMIEGVRSAGVERLLLVTGDDRYVAERVAAAAGITTVVGRVHARAQARGGQGGARTGGRHGGDGR